MFIVQSYPLAVVLCVLTMLCWGSWANTRKLARKDWRFELFYWDYAIGVVLLTLLLGLTLGSTGGAGSPFGSDLAQPPAAVSGPRSSAGRSSTWPTSCWSPRLKSPAWQWPSR